MTNPNHPKDQHVVFDEVIYRFQKKDVQEIPESSMYFADKGDKITNELNEPELKNRPISRMEHLPKSNDKNQFPNNAANSKLDQE